MTNNKLTLGFTDFEEIGVEDSLLLFLLVVNVQYVINDDLF